MVGHILLRKSQMAWKQNIWIYLAGDVSGHIAEYIQFFSQRKLSEPDA
jgi:hypothetical protein